MTSHNKGLSLSDKGGRGERLGTILDLGSVKRVPDCLTLNQANSIKKRNQKLLVGSRKCDSIED